MNTHKSKPDGFDSNKKCWKVPPAERLAALAYEYARHCKPLLADASKRKPTIYFARTLKAVPGFPRAGWIQLKATVRAGLVKRCQDQIEPKPFREVPLWELDNNPTAPSGMYRVIAEIDLSALDDEILSAARDLLIRTLARYRAQAKKSMECVALETAARIRNCRDSARVAHAKQNSGAGSRLRKCEEFLRKLAATSETAAPKASVGNVYVNKSDYSIARLECVGMLGRLFEFWQRGAEFVDPWDKDSYRHSVGMAFIYRPIDYKMASKERRAVIREQFVELFAVPGSLAAFDPA